MTNLTVMANGDEVFNIGRELWREYRFKKASF